ncbi:MAG: murein biosynthesis integral membrane protein MurJ [Spirochaetia bacterium]|nr:murein biosynthesis integral membrane protein MurJ [Spirochaetia bacterium]
MPAQNDQETAKNTSIFSFFTIISRILGLVRDVLKAYAFGTGYLAVAFDIAFRIPNSLRNLVAEGALAQSFIPIYENSKKKSLETARELAGIIYVFIFLSLGFFTILAILTIPYIIPYLVHDPLKNENSTLLTINLCQILFPYILFMSLSSIYMGIQYSHNKFWAPSFGSALLNIIVIIFFGLYLIFQSKLNSSQETLVYVFSIITLLGGFIHLVFQGKVVKKLALRPKYVFKIKHPAIKGLFFMMLPAAFGSAVHEIGQIIDIFLATYLHEEVPGAVSALTYSHRLLHLPIGVFGAAVSTASLPQLSRIFESNNKREFNESLFNSIGLNLYLLIPAALGLIIFAEPIVGIIFEYGEFDKTSTQITAVALQYYAVGIPAYGMQKLFISSYYAQKNSKTPAVITWIVLFINVILSIFFMQYIKHAGLAFGSALAAYFGILIYSIKLRKIKLFVLDKKQIKNILTIVFINFILCLFLLFLNNFTNQFKYYIRLIITIPCALIVYFLLSKIINLYQWQLFQVIIEKVKKKLK